MVASYNDNVKTGDEREEKVHQYFSKVDVMKASHNGGRETLVCIIS